MLVSYRKVCGISQILCTYFINDRGRFLSLATVIKWTRRSELIIKLFIRVLRSFLHDLTADRHDLFGVPPKQQEDGGHNEIEYYLVEIVVAL